ncbi:MAG: serine O-acetyltransferase [Planctomycetota bacterium]
MTIYNGVSLGARTIQKLDEHKETENRYPTIEDDVVIFPGAKIIGPVVIGAGSIVGANSVVNQSFPANSIIAGAPARQVGTRK